LGVTDEVAFNTFGQEALAATLTATGKGGTPAFAFHSCAKTMLPFSRPFGWLICSFHRPENQFSCG
jgi:hypothetical protein